jgi:hypothetical protein
MPPRAGRSRRWWSVWMYWSRTARRRRSSSRTSSSDRCSTGSLWNVVAVSLRQRITPDRILGRINSSYRLVAWGTRPLGAAAGGLLGELLGLRAVFGIAAALILATLIGMPQLTDTAISAAEHDAAN